MNGRRYSTMKTVYEIENDDGTVTVDDETLAELLELADSDDDEDYDDEDYRVEPYLENYRG